MPDLAFANRLCLASFLAVSC